MRKFKLLAIALILALAMTTGLAFAGTEISRGTGTSFTHNEKFDDCVVVKGVDVSQFQGKINWQLMKSAGCDFAIIRIGGRSYSDGHIYSDDYFEEYYKGAKEAGLLIGAYFYSQATTIREAKEEVHYCVKKLAGKELDLPLFMDYEGGGGSSAWLNGANLTIEEQTEVAIAFLREVQVYGYDAGFYSYLNYVKGSKAQVKGSEIGKLFPMWIAQYSSECTYKSDYEMWQYSSSGKLRGTQGSSCDLDYWYLPRSSKIDEKAEAFARKNIAFADCKINDCVLSYIYQDNYGFEPMVDVEYQGQKLERDIDYEVEYVSNCNVGTAHAKIKGIGKYYGYQFIDFTLCPTDDISNLKIEKEYTVKYTGKEISPTAINILEASGNRITGNLDYTFDNFKSKAVGTYNVKVKLDGNYQGTLSTKIKITKGTQKITFGTKPTSVYSDREPFNLNVSLKYSGGKVTYSSSNTKVATVSSSGKVTVKGTGSTKITVKAAGTKDYDGVTETFTLKVSKRPKTPSGQDTPKPEQHDLSKLREKDHLIKIQRKISPWRKVIL